MKIRKSLQAGFTMIELIIVIVILGILAAVALPKFVDISSDAKVSATQGVAGALASANSINYGGCLITNNVVTAGKCSKISSCTDANMPTLMQGGALPTGYTVSAGSGTATSTSNGVNLNCIANAPGSAASATFVAIAAGN